MVISPDIDGDGNLARMFALVFACEAVANIMKSSLGLVGLDKFATEAAITILWIYNMIKLFKDDQNDQD